ncbi:hypothetical protein [Bacillus taeanensis]|uniref:Uncharacterized protein n=1 Tax=Bacillus taeanensis TaxID=273032 RepID=A0A366XMY1_9BACI|nr:hypothetical protein [Bacillus taeanensis]RBW67482.1 hypothetical protein DS031_22010 [Bacillus taeanensis]
MSERDLAIGAYAIFIIVSFFVSYKYGTFMIKKTGLFFTQVFIAVTINIALGMLALIGWFFYSLGVNEFLFLGGLFLGTALLVITEIVLLILLFVKRKRMLKIFNEVNHTN